jgi:hypothetical protein
VELDGSDGQTVLMIPHTKRMGGPNVVNRDASTARANRHRQTNLIKLKCGDLIAEINQNTQRRKQA